MSWALLAGRLSGGLALGRGPAGPAPGRVATATRRAQSAWALTYRRHGPPPEALRLERVAVPAPGPGEVRVRMLAAPVNPDSLYRKVERPQRLFNPLKIPKNLQARLPYKTKPKQEQALKRRTLDQKRQVLMEKPERKAHSLLQMLNTIRNEKAKKRRDQQAVRRAKRARCCMFA